MGIILYFNCPDWCELSNEYIGGREMSKKGMPISWQVEVIDPQLMPSGLVSVRIVVTAKRGNTGFFGATIEKIFIDKSDFTTAFGKMTTNTKGQYAFRFEDIPVDQRSIEVTIHVDSGKEISDDFSISKVTPPTLPKAGWFNATCGNPCSDKKVKGRTVVKTKEDGDLVTGKVRVSSNRPFVIEKDNITGTETEKREWPLTVDGEMLFEIQMSSDPNHKQQQIFFVLEETGQEIKKFLAIR
jgi:hypothetical protein